MAQMTALRRRMIDDMTVRNLSPATQQSYVYAVAKFSRFFDCLQISEFPTGDFGSNRQAVSVEIGTPLRMGFGPDFGEPPLRDTSYLALVCQSKYSCHYYSFY